jgi:hypothetical protein
VGAGADAPPDGALAAALAAAATGCEPIAVERFTSGLQHYVFETRFAGRAPVVVRIAAEDGHAAMVGAAKLSRMSRPLGVPLPEVIAERLAPLFPQLVLERLPGADLGNVVNTLPASRLVIVDVDDLCFGDPRYLAALTLASLLAAAARPDYVHAWMEIANFRDDRVFRLYVALFLVDFMSEHGQRFNQNLQLSSPEARRRLLEVFGGNMRRATS